MWRSQGVVYGGRVEVGTSVNVKGFLNYGKIRKYRNRCKTRETGLTRVDGTNPTVGLYPTPNLPLVRTRPVLTQEVLTVLPTTRKYTGLSCSTVSPEVGSFLHDSSFCQDPPVWRGLFDGRNQSKGLLKKFKPK